MGYWQLTAEELRKGIVPSAIDGRGQATAIVEATALTVAASADGALEMAAPDAPFTTT